jgi:hypothetical protein
VSVGDMTPRWRKSHQPRWPRVLNRGEKAEIINEVVEESKRKKERDQMKKKKKGQMT